MKRNHPCTACGKAHYTHREILESMRCDACGGALLTRRVPARVFRNEMIRRGVIGEPDMNPRSRRHGPLVDRSASRRLDANGHGFVAKIRTISFWVTLAVLVLALFQLFTSGG